MGFAWLKKLFGGSANDASQAAPVETPVETPSVETPAQGSVAETPNEEMPKEEENTQSL